MKKNVLLFFILLSANSCFSQNTFYSLYTMPNQDSLGNSKTVIPTRDGGYLVFHMGLGLTKYDSTGNFLWGKLYSYFPYYYSQSVNTVIELSDKSIMFWGVEATYWHCLMRVDSLGNLMYAKSFPFPLSIMAMFQAPDSNIIFFGTIVKSVQSGDTIVGVMIKTDLNGNFIWQKNIAPDDHSACVDLQATQDINGNFFVAGSFSHYNVAATNYFIQKIDSSGNILWSQNFNENYNQINITGILLKDNEVYIQVFLRDSAMQFLYPDLTKVSASNGQIIWSKRYIEPYWAGYQGIIETSSGKIICYGQTEITYPNWFYFTEEIDSSGNSLNQRFYYLPNVFDFYCGSFAETNDNGFILCGSVGDNVKIPSLIKTDSLFQSPCFDSIPTMVQPITRSLTQTSSGYSSSDSSSIVDITPFINPLPIFLNRIDVCSTWVDIPSSTNSEFSFYPNPATDQVKIVYPGIESKSIEIFNLMGEKILSAASPDFNNHKELTIKCEQWPAGIYFITLQTENGIAVQKLIKQ